MLYDPLNTLIDANSLRFIRIGNDVQISRGVIILAHDYSYSVCNCISKLPRVQRRTVIGDNVFIGMNSIILMGAKIGDNVIIGAGSIVHGNVESDSVYAGNPAKKICTLEEYAYKNEALMSSSALIYAQEHMRVSGEMPSIAQMGFYSALFVDKDDISIQQYYPSTKFSKAIKNIKKQYDSTRELIEEGDTLDEHSINNANKTK